MLFLMLDYDQQNPHHHAPITQPPKVRIHLSLDIGCPAEDGFPAYFGHWNGERKLGPVSCPACLFVLQTVINACTAILLTCIHLVCVYPDPFVMVLVAESILATVRGVDLYPPPVNWEPPNCVFEVDDILRDWTWSEPFDLIHLRMMLGAFTPEGWDRLYKQCYE